MKNEMKDNIILIPNVLLFFSYNNIYEIVVAETKKKNKKLKLKKYIYN